MTILLGHTQAQFMTKIQPMKMAAAEALWDSEDPAAMSLFTIGDEKNRKDVFALRIPAMLSFLSYNSFSGEVKGINDIQKEYEQKYGPGNYVPPVAMSYWTFRIMIGAGFLMLLFLILGLPAVFKDKFDFKAWYLKFLVWAIALPFIANSTGWIFTEMARQPWVVFGLFKTADGVSKAVSPFEVFLSLVLFTALYAVLIVADVYLLKKYAIAGTGVEEEN